MYSIKYKLLIGMFLIFLNSCQAQEKILDPIIKPHYSTKLVNNIIENSKIKDITYVVLTLSIIDTTYTFRLERINFTNYQYKNTTECKSYENYEDLTNLIEKFLKKSLVIKPNDTSKSLERQSIVVKFKK